VIVELDSAEVYERERSPSSGVRAGFPVGLLLVTADRRTDRATVKHRESRDNEPNVKPRENKAAAGALMEGRGQLVLEVACWFVLFALIGVIAYYRWVHLR
jgi:hypothetical protein